MGLFGEKETLYLKDQGFLCRGFQPYQHPIDSNGVENTSKKEQYRQQINWQKITITHCYNFYKDNLPVLVLFEILNTAWVTPFLKLEVPLMPFSITFSAPFNRRMPSVRSSFVPTKEFGWKDKVFILENWVTQYMSYLMSKVCMRVLLRIFFWNSVIPGIDYHKLFKRAGYTVQWGDYAEVSFRIKRPTLYMSPAEFDFPSCRDTGDRIYAGASVQLNRREGAFHWPKDAAGKKYIYATLGSLSSYYGGSHRRNFYNALLDVLREERNYDLILQVGCRDDLTGLDIPANVHIYDWVPHTEVFGNIYLIICHAGLGTLREAIFHGVPTIVLPWGGDQLGNAARIVYHNLGVRNEFRTVKSTDLKKSIEIIESDSTIRSAVQQFSVCFKKQEALQLDINFFEKEMSSLKSTRRQ